MELFLIALSLPPVCWSLACWSIGAPKMEAQIWEEACSQVIW